MTVPDTAKNSRTSENQAQFSLSANRPISTISEIFPMTSRMIPVCSSTFCTFCSSPPSAFTRSLTWRGNSNGVMAPAPGASFPPSAPAGPPGGGVPGRRSTETLTFTSSPSQACSNEACDEDTRPASCGSPGGRCHRLDPVSGARSSGSRRPRFVAVNSGVTAAAAGGGENRAPPSGPAPAAPAPPPKRGESTNGVRPGPGPGVRPPW